MDHHDPKKETAFDGACAMSIVASSFWSQLWRRQWLALALLLWNSHGNWARNLPYLASLSNCNGPIGPFYFSFWSSFRKIRAILPQRLWSHVLTLAGCGSPSLSPVWCHPWMDDRTDRWMDGRLHEKWPWSPLLYVICTFHFHNEKPNS